MGEACPRVRAASRPAERKVARCFPAASRSLPELLHDASVLSHVSFRFPSIANIKMGGSLCEISARLEIDWDGA
jgi:hypothetical protein